MRRPPNSPDWLARGSIRRDPRPRSATAFHLRRSASAFWGHALGLNHEQELAFLNQVAVGEFPQPEKALRAGAQVDIVGGLRATGDVVDAFDAIATSVAAVRLNLRPMALWAASIVFLVVLGMVPGMIGLLVTLPLVAYATWHAYRDVVRFD